MIREKRPVLLMLTAVLLLMTSCVKHIDSIDNEYDTEKSTQEMTPEDVKEDLTGGKAAIIYSEQYEEGCRFIEEVLKGDEDLEIVVLNDVPDPSEYPLVIAGKDRQKELQGFNNIIFLEDLFDPIYMADDICGSILKDLDARGIEDKIIAAGPRLGEALSDKIGELCQQNGAGFIRLASEDDYDTLFSDHPEGFGYIAYDPEEALKIRDKMIDLGMQDKVSIFSLLWSDEIESSMRKVMVFGSLVEDIDAARSYAKERISVPKKLYGNNLILVTRENIDSPETEKTISFRRDFSD